MQSAEGVDNEVRVIRSGFGSPALSSIVLVDEESHGVEMSRRSHFRPQKRAHECTSRDPSPVDRQMLKRGGSIAREIPRRGDLARSWLLPFRKSRSSRVRSSLNRVRRVSLPCRKMLDTISSVAMHLKSTMC
jgi:hypothetical protein